jgi:2-oxoglutarate ferredoxin oxidoreductase subunit beta
VLKHRYCSGCGHINISKEVEKQLIECAGLLVGTVGCSVALPDLFQIVDAVSAAHGRGLSVATALKKCLPETKILVYAGDGDCCTIGAGELIHTILRNPKIVCILINNQIFGMTGFQMSAGTPVGLKTKTTVNGRNEIDNGIPLNVRLLMKQNPKTKYYLTNAASKAGIELFKKQLKEALEYDGFSLIEVISPCVTFWGNAKKAYEYSLKLYEEKLNESMCKCHEKIDEFYWEDRNEIAIQIAYENRKV